MPLYEYQCPKCGRFEIIKKFSDAPLTACPTCGRKVERLLSAPAIQFKGTGWYVTDYAKKSSGGSEGGESKGSGASSSSSKESGNKEKSEKSASDKGGSKETPAKGSGSSK